MQIVYLGTPEFAVPTLKSILQAGHRVPLVITQPDRPRGRGQNVGASPVKQCAIESGIEVFQPDRIRKSDASARISALAPDLMVVVGYGQIIPRQLIDLPHWGIVNVHASLLPRWRGAAPIQWAIRHGDSVTGITTMQIDEGLDTGDILLKKETPIHPDEDAIQLGARLAEMGAELMIETLK